MKVAAALSEEHPAVDKGRERSPQEISAIAVAALSASPDCIKIISAEGHIEYVSEGGLTVLEADCPDALIGAYWPAFWDDEEQPRVYESLQRALTGDTCAFEGYCPSLRGTPKWWDVCVSPFWDDVDGKMKALVVSRDVTTQYLSAKELASKAARQELLRHLADKLADARDEKDLVDTLFLAAPEDLGIDITLAYAADRASGLLSIRQAKGIEDSRIDSLRTLDFFTTPCGQAAGSGVPIVLENIQTSDEPICSMPRESGLQSFVAFPLFTNEHEVIGVLSFGSRSRSSFSRGDVSLLSSIANIYSSVIRRMMIVTALRESEENLRLLIDGASGHALYRLDCEGIISSWNDGAQRMHGFTSDEAIGQSYSILFTQQDRDAGTPRQLLEAASVRGFADASGTRLRHDGSHFDVAGSLTALKDANEILVGFAKVSSDITQRLHYENALKTSEANLRAVVDTAVDAIIVADEGGIIRSFNRAAETMFGWRAIDVVGRSLNCLMDNEHAYHHRRGMDDYQRTGVARIIGIGREVTGLRKDGSEIPLEVSIAAWRDAEDREFYTGIIRDLTERKAAERAKADAHEAVARASRLTALGAMASTIAHELNQPLTALRNYLSLLDAVLKSAEPDLAAAQMGVAKGLEANRRVGEIINRMRSFAKNGQIRAEPVEINSCVSDAWAKIAQGGGANGLNFRMKAGIFSIWVRADKVQLEQVLLNLFRNAIEATEGQPDRLIVVETELLDRGASILVKDNGPGLAPDRLADPIKLFSSTKENGTGLGLPVSATIIEAHGGSLTAETSDCGGAAFRILLPVA